MKKDITTLLSRIDRRMCNNTQKALLRLLQEEGNWVAVSKVRIPSAPSRIRDLRKAKFGSFTVNCARGSEIKRRSDSTFYSLDMQSVTTDRLRTAFRTALEV